MCVCVCVGSPFAFFAKKRKELRATFLAFAKRPNLTITVLHDTQTTVISSVRSQSANSAILYYILNSITYVSMNHFIIRNDRIDDSKKVGSGRHAVQFVGVECISRSLQ